MNLYESLKHLNPEVNEIVTTRIINATGVVVGWSSIVNTNSQLAYSGGTSEDKDTSMRIAIAECFERSFFYKYISDCEMMYELCLDKHPSASGFACGFDRQGVVFRSTCEAIERWAWSQWIDYHYKMDNVTESQKSEIFNNLLTNHLSSVFSSSNMYLKKIRYNDTAYNFVVYVGYAENGAFAGSRVSTSEDPSIWQHAVIEAYRNYINFMISQKSNDPDYFNKINSIIAKRSYYFARNKEVAVNAMSLSNKDRWPNPVVDKQININTGINGVYLCRTIMKDFIGWHIGDHTRFVY